MAGNPRENVKGKGFWDGGASGHGSNGESAGKSSGYPGRRTPSKTGVQTDLDFPPHLPVGDDDTTSAESCRLPVAGCWIPDASATSNRQPATA